MSFSARTEYSCHVNTEKEYTCFKWNFPDFSLLKEYYKNIWACEFMITNSDAKCNLEFVVEQNEPKPTISPAPSTPSFGVTTRNSALFGHGDSSSIPAAQLGECAYIYVHFNPDGQPFDKMKVIISILDGSGGKAFSINKIRAPTQYQMCFKLIDFSTSFDSRGPSNYLHNDQLTILCEIINIKKQESIVNDTKKFAGHFSNETEKKIQIYFEDKIFCDVVFAVGNKEFHAHKVIVAANSPVFEAMFATEMSEKNDKIVNITDIDETTFEAFLKYIYTGSVLKMDELASDLLIIADKYELMSLMNLCEIHIANNLGKENAIGYLLLAHLHNFETLKSKALKFIRSCKEEIVEAAEFKNVCSYPDLVTEIFGKSI